jgi:hypothetical protein
LKISFQDKFNKTYENINEENRHFEIFSRNFAKMEDKNEHMETEEAIAENIDKYFDRTDEEKAKEESK